MIGKLFFKSLITFNRYIRHSTKPIILKQKLIGVKKRNIFLKKNKRFLKLIKLNKFIIKIIWILSCFRYQRKTNFLAGGFGVSGSGTTKPS